MAKFLFVYRNSAEIDKEFENASPEQMQEAMAKWGQWFQAVGSAIVDGGDGLLPTGKIVKGNTITDGPFIEAKELVGGYSILEAENYEQAAELATGCPIIELGGTVEIRELAGYSVDSNG